MEIINNLLDKYFRKKSSIWLVLIISIIVWIMSLNNINNLIGKIILAICIIGVNIYYIIDVIKYNTLPKAKQGKNSVLVRVAARSKDEYDDIIFKFASEFKNYITRDNTQFDVQYIPFHLVESNNSKSKEDIMKLLKKTNCIFLVDLKNKSEDLKDDAIYVTELNLGIKHPTYLKNVEELFQKELTILGIPISKLEYSKREKIEKLEITAKKVSLICEYIIGRACFLNGLNDVAQEIATKLINKLDGSIDNNLVRMTKSLCYESYIESFNREYNKKEINYELLEKYLNEANKYIKGTYVYYEGMSICAFQNHRDIKRTKDYIGHCKQLNSHGPWRYSDAFISAYLGETEGKVIYKYLQALKKEYNYMQLISFIEDVLDKENINMLRFALVILYSELEQFSVAKELLKEYLNNKETHCLESNTIEKFKKRYENKLLEEQFKK